MQSRATLLTPWTARRIDAAIKGLADDPRPAAATKLVGADAWRLRVGDYRVIYTITDAVRVVTVTNSATAEASTKGERHGLQDDSGQ